MQYSAARPEGSPAQWMLQDQQLRMLATGKHQLQPEDRVSVLCGNGPRRLPWVQLCLHSEARIAVNRTHSRLYIPLSRAAVHKA